MFEAYKVCVLVEVISSLAALISGIGNDPSLPPGQIMFPGVFSHVLSPPRTLAPQRSVIARGWGRAGRGGEMGPVGHPALDVPRIRRRVFGR